MAEKIAKKKRQVSKTEAKKIDSKEKDKITVKAKYLRISYRKVVPWLRKFRGLSTEEAIYLCQSGKRKIFQLVVKLINSGVAAAEDQNIETDNLKIEKIICQQGPTLKRQLIKSKGRADIIRKRTCHLVLSMRERSPDRKDDQKDTTKDKDDRKNQKARKIKKDQESKK
jgi:large subunit ribosomal protein L22